MKARLVERLAEPIEETRRKSEALLERCIEAGVVVRAGKPVGDPLTAQLATRGYGISNTAFHRRRSATAITRSPRRTMWRRRK